MTRFIKFIGLFWSVLLAFPTFSQALFDQILEDKLQAQVLPLLNAPLLEQRLFATSVFLDFPQWSLPIIREALQNSEWQIIHWRLAYLLGTLGSQADIPLLLSATPQTTATFQNNLWKGAAERLFWRHRKSPSRKYIITRLRFLFEERQDHLISGQLLYRIVNPDNEGRLIATHFDLWHAHLEKPVFQPYYWIEAGDVLEVQLPLVFSMRPTWKTFRIDLKVEEVGNHQGFIHHKIEVPLSTLKNQE